MSDRHVYSDKPACDVCGMHEIERLAGSLFKCPTQRELRDRVRVLEKAMAGMLNAQSVDETLASFHEFVILLKRRI